MIKYIAANAVSAFLLVSVAEAQGWELTKNVADDVIYSEPFGTFYCGCPYVSDGDSDGSGDIIYENGAGERVCGFEQEPLPARAEWIEWEHVVPASLMPARQFECWAGEGGSRGRCESADPRAQAMIYDLHNLVPSIGQVNGLRSNDRYADLPDDTSTFGSCQIEDSSGYFEPPACTRGDVARIWFYMRAAHGVEIPPYEEAMFLQWAAADPVSPWEIERERRIAAYSRVNNPFVHGVTPSAAGACPWEPIQ